MSDPPRTPSERFGATIRCLILTIDGHSTWGRVPRPLGWLIMNRIMAISYQFARVVARVAAGTYFPRRFTAGRPRTSKAPRRKDPLPHEFRWLVRLVQETANYGSQLEYLFRDPEMAALLAAAPTSFRRPLRSLCRMLGVIPPKILAVPTKPRPPAPPATAAPASAAPAPGGPAPRPARRPFPASLPPPGTKLPPALGGPPRRTA